MTIDWRRWITGFNFFVSLLEYESKYQEHTMTQKNQYSYKTQSRKLSYVLIVIFTVITIGLVISLAPELGLLGTIAASISSVGYLGVLSMILLVE